MNHSIKLRHGWYNLHFDAHDAGDEDGNGDLEVQNVDVDADEDVDDSIKITVKACRICILMAAPCWSLLGSQYHLCHLSCGFKVLKILIRLGEN